MPKNYTGIGESGGIDKHPAPPKRVPWKGTGEQNIAKPDSGSHKSSNTNPAWPKVTKAEGS